MTEKDGTKELRVISGGLDDPQGSEPRNGKGQHRSAKTASGLTEKQEKFCAGLANGLTNAEAYREAFDADGYKPHTLYCKASALAARADIRARVAQIVTERKGRKQHVDAQMSERISDRVWRGIWAIAEDHNAPAAARISALQLAAKAGGMLVDRVETKNLNVPEDIEAELKARLAKFTGTNG